MDYCCAGRVRFCRYPRGRTHPRALVPDDCSIESDCVPIYVACTVRPVPCLPCTYAELHFQNPNDALKSEVRACQRRYFGEVWDLVFNHVFRSESTWRRSFDGESSPVPGPDADAVADADAEADAEAEPPADSEAEKKPGKKYFTISTRPVKESSNQLGAKIQDTRKLMETGAQNAVQLNNLQRKKSQGYLAGRTAPRRSYAEDEF